MSNGVSSGWRMPLIRSKLLACWLETLAWNIINWKAFSSIFYRLTCIWKLALLIISDVDPQRALGWPRNQRQLERRSGKIQTVLERVGWSTKPKSHWKRRDISEFLSRSHSQKSWIFSQNHWDWGQVVFWLGSFGFGNLKKLGKLCCFRYFLAKKPMPLPNPEDRDNIEEKCKSFKANQTPQSKNDLIRLLSKAREDIIAHYLKRDFDDFLSEWCSFAQHEKNNIFLLIILMIIL